MPTELLLSGTLCPHVPRNYLLRYYAETEVLVRVRRKDKAIVGY